MDIFEQFKDIIRLPVRDPVRVVELGACNGSDSIRMNDILEGSSRPYEQYAIEPCKANFDGLDRTLFERKITKLNLAIGATNGVVDFWESDRKYYGSSSIREPAGCLTAWPDMGFTKKTIACATLDVLFSGRHIDFIWADIQGAEEDMIRGGTVVLSNTRYLYTEYCNGELYKGEIGLDGIMALLPDWEIVEKYDGDNVLLCNTKWGLK